jgi:hypothetical protein
LGGVAMPMAVTAARKAYAGRFIFLLLSFETRNLMSYFNITMDWIEAMDGMAYIVYARRIHPLT